MSSLWRITATGRGLKPIWYSAGGNSDCRIKRSATMGLIKPSVPGDVLRAFTSGLGDFVRPGSPLWSLLLNKYVAIQAYNLQLDSFCGIDSPDAVTEFNTLKENSFKSSGWRFLAGEGDLYGG